MKRPIRIVYFGTPFFAAELLRYLNDHHVSVAAIVTQPDRPKGRSLHLTSSPVKEAALEKIPGVPIFQPLKASEESFLEQLLRLEADLYVVVAYGQILSQKLLDIPPLGCINVHASLLPKYRGAAPIHRCLMAGETETGIAIQKMVRQLDAGDVIAVSKIEIPQEMNFGELESALCSLAKPLLLSVIQSYEEKGIPEAVPQDHALATYASKIELEEGLIDWTWPARQIHNLIRAFSPRPGAWCWVESGGEKKRLKILRTQVLDQQGQAGVFFPSSEIVACGKDSLRLIDVQPEGRKTMAAADWLRGQKTFRFLDEKI